MTNLERFYGFLLNSSLFPQNLEGEAFVHFAFHFSPCDIKPHSFSILTKGHSHIAALFTVCHGSPNFPDLLSNVLALSAFLVMRKNWLLTAFFSFSARPNIIYVNFLKSSQSAPSPPKSQRNRKV